MKPNIFNIATKELSQDAFIAWLLQYADEKYQAADPLINKCGKSFVTRLIKTKYPDFAEDVKVVRAYRQVQCIDIWVEVDEKYLIIIEDKTNTSERSDQLLRYRSIADAWCKEKQYEAPICIYLKTGDQSQSSLLKNKEQGFSSYSRIDFINLLQDYIHTTNDIFLDFHQRLVSLEQSNNEFQHKPIGEWEGRHWQGFFQSLEKDMDILNWHFVNNPAGGFWNALLSWDYWLQYPAYLQLEQGKLCFKLSTDPAELDLPDGVSRSAVRNQLSTLILNEAKAAGLTEIRRPNRFGNGSYMTVAVVDSEHWLGADDQIVDKQEIIRKINLYLTFMRNIICRRLVATAV